METGANNASAGNKNETKSAKPNRKLPYVKALRLTEVRGRMEETKEVKAFPRIAWEKMFRKDHSPLLPNFNWKFIEYIPAPGNDDVLSPEITGGSELQSEIEKAAKLKAEAELKAKAEIEKAAK